MTTSYDRRCQTFWSGGHLCMESANHPTGQHRCASTKCPSLHLVAACWGPDAGADAFGVLPYGADLTKPFRPLKRAA